VCTDRANVDNEKTLNLNGVKFTRLSHGLYDVITVLLTYATLAIRLLEVLFSRKCKCVPVNELYPYIAEFLQEAQLSPSDRAMHLVSSNLANYHATVQKLLIRQVLTKPMVRSWRFSWKQCVINKPTTVELCISPVHRRLAVAKFSKSTM